MIEKAAVAGGAALTATQWWENYPGFPEPVLGKQLARDMEAQARFFGLEIVNEAVKAVILAGEIKEITTDYNTWKARAVLISTGSSPKTLNVPGEKEYSGHGVSMVQPVMDHSIRIRLWQWWVVAFSFEESLFIAKYAARIYIIIAGIASERSI